MSNLQEALVTILEKATAATEAGVAFLSAEIPEVIRELLLWKMMQHGVLGTVGLVVCLATLLFSRRAVFVTKPEWLFEQDGNPTLWGLPMFFANIGAFFCIFPAFKQLLTMLQIIVAPRVYLIEYAANLVQGAK